MLQALTTKRVFIFQGLVYNHSYLIKIERFNTSSWGADKAEIISNWWGTIVIAYLKMSIPI
jgi:hypothetical protein